MIAIKRVYEPSSATDGTRVLVDRLWPRGLTKASANIQEWLRDVAPSNPLRHWYHAHPERWEEFRAKYLKELSQPDAQPALQRLYALADGSKHLTLVFASKNETTNNAVVLKELLEGKRKPPRSTGITSARGARKREAAVRRR